MARDTVTDDITLRLVDRLAEVLALLSGWGVLSSGEKAVYSGLLLPFPQEPFPCGYCYVEAQDVDQAQGTGYHYINNFLVVRILGGPVTPKYRINPERSVYTMASAVVNELAYRRYLENQAGKAFPNIAPDGKLTVGRPRGIRKIDYGEQGGFAGMEIPATVKLAIHVGRRS